MPPGENALILAAQDLHDDVGIDKDGHAGSSLSDRSSSRKLRR
jgi:hypothetical protein